MKVAEVMKKMIAFSEGNRHDINHLMKVYTYAKTIGECEGLDEQTQLTLELAAIVHDIACPLCRVKYGNTNGKKQELEGYPLTKEFFADTDIPEQIVERVAYLVGHHHTFTDVDGMDHQILLEADYLVNSDESGYSMKNIQNTLEHVYKTQTGIALLKSIYKI